MPEITASQQSEARKLLTIAGECLRQATPSTGSLKSGSFLRDALHTLNGGKADYYPKASVPSYILKQVDLCISLLLNSADPQSERALIQLERLRATEPFSRDNMVVEGASSTFDMFSPEVFLKVLFGKKTPPTLIQFQKAMAFLISIRDFVRQQKCKVIGHDELVILARRAGLAGPKQISIPDKLKSAIFKSELLLPIPEIKGVLANHYKISSAGCAYLRDLKDLIKAKGEKKGKKKR